MAKASKGHSVKVHYTGKLTSGEVFDSSADGDPLAFEIGAGQMIPGFDEAVDGMEVNEKKTVIIPADQAYGPRREEMVVQVDRKEFPAHITPEVGLQLQAQNDEGQPFLVTITEVEDAQVTLDANHPLAGQDLVFEIELVAID